MHWLRSPGGALNQERENPGRQSPSFRTLCSRYKTSGLGHSRQRLPFRHFERRAATTAIATRYQRRQAGQSEDAGGRDLDPTMGWHRHQAHKAVRAAFAKGSPPPEQGPQHGRSEIASILPFPLLRSQYSRSPCLLHGSRCAPLSEVALFRFLSTVPTTSQTPAVNGGSPGISDGPPGVITTYHNGPLKPYAIPALAPEPS